jgi:hypothetical protein
MYINLEKMKYIYTIWSQRVESCLFFLRAADSHSFSIYSLLVFLFYSPLLSDQEINQFIIASLLSSARSSAQWIVQFKNRCFFASQDQEIDLFLWSSLCRLVFNTYTFNSARSSRIADCSLLSPPKLSPHQTNSPQQTRIRRDRYFLRSSLSWSPLRCTKSRVPCDRRSDASTCVCFLIASFSIAVDHKCASQLLLIFFW